MEEATEDIQKLGGMEALDAPYLRIYPVYAGSDVRWGTDTLVGLVDRAAKSVRKQFPDAVLSVGQLSKNGGAPQAVVFVDAKSTLADLIALDFAKVNPVAGPVFIEGAQAGDDDELTH